MKTLTRITAAALLAVVCSTNVHASGPDYGDIVKDARELQQSAARFQEELADKFQARPEYNFLRLRASIVRNAAARIETSALGQGPSPHNLAYIRQQLVTIRSMLDGMGPKVEAIKSAEGSAKTLKLRIRFGKMKDEFQDISREVD